MIPAHSMDECRDFHMAIVETPPPTCVVLRCHLCGKEKAGSPARALYELAFHYDRRHKGWATTEGEAQSLPS